MLMIKVAAALLTVGSLLLIVDCSLGIKIKRRQLEELENDDSDF